ncbi:MAG: hypothetical protein KDE04_17610, partial [Anaerolineales bacterium]|nr:hypothetical protein [Anaerolineales bacterium]
DSGNYLLVDVPVSGPTTLYPAIGGVVGMLATAGLVVMMAYALLTGRRRQTDVGKEPVLSS